ncbi:MAG: ferrous iron transport protein B, partial [Oscillospiraceae bacterium]|nr:ferrous iron transport protein B [Oscillospiraceae bacterium]
MDIRIALAGNPNAGKTTLFNALTGSNQFVGNWPGVTVEKKEGRLKGHKDVIITDLPGIYSLSPYTLEEVVARNYLIGERPDAILNIIDGTNLERNLYLTTQLVELGIPVVCAVNMMDVVRKNGDNINTEQLASVLGCKVVEISALKGTGILEASTAAIEAARSGEKSVPKHEFCGCVEHAIAHIEEAVLHDVPEEQQRWYAIKIFERDEKVLEMLNIPADKQAHIEAHIEHDIAAAEKEMDDDSESIITNERYIYIASVIKGCLKKKNRGGMTVSDKIDKIVTNRILALPIFAAIMFIVYYVSITTVGGWATDWTNETLFADWITNGANSFLESIGCAAWLQGLIVDGIIGGVGSVLGFVPQMLVLFIFLAFLESCGYMARIAFVMDRIFRKFGLSGKSFIPMLIGTGCGVPGIMASRTIENERDRRMTIITTTFIPCSAKLPIIGLIAGALFGNAGWVGFTAYFIGVAAIIVSGIMLKKTTLFAGDPAPFVMELPAYHLPTVGNVLRSMWERGWSFIKKAGTVILLSTVVIWFLQGFGVEDGSFGMVEDIDNSVLAAVGNVIAPIFAPLGWGNWQSSVAAVTGLVAKENVVATFGMLFHFDGELAENGDEIWTNVAASFTQLSAFSYLIFNLLCAPC